VSFKDLVIIKPDIPDLESAYTVFEQSITLAFEEEGISPEETSQDIAHKKALLLKSVTDTSSDYIFMVAKLDDIVIGTISYGPCSHEIGVCTNNELDDVGELGSLYVLPEYQGQGVGSALINAMLKHLHSMGVEQFCLDCGLKAAQQRWLRKFGAPYKVAKDYWGEGSDHIVWLCNVKDFV